jgi:hypothetical protein
MEAIEAVKSRMIDKVTSLSEVGQALNPTKKRGLTEFYEAENENSVYITENQYRSRFL